MSEPASVAADPPAPIVAAPAAQRMICVHCGSPPMAPNWTCACAPQLKLAEASAKPVNPPTAADLWGPTVPVDLKALVRDWLGKVREGRNAYSIAAGCRREIEVILRELEAAAPLEKPVKKGWWADFMASLGDPPKPKAPMLSERVAKLAKAGLLTNDFITPAKALEGASAEAAAGTRLNISPDEAEAALRVLIALILVHYEAPGWLNGR